MRPWVATTTPPAAVSAEDQAVVDSIPSGPPVNGDEPKPTVPATSEEEDEEDILAAAARADAEVEELQAAETPAFDDSEVEDDDEPEDEPEAETSPTDGDAQVGEEPRDAWSQAAIDLAQELLQLAGWHPITDDDLQDSGAALFPLVCQHGSEPIRDCITWAMAEKKFWGPKLREAGHPGSFFAKSFNTIQKQAAPALRKKAERRNGPNARLLNILMGRDVDEAYDPDEAEARKKADIAASIAAWSA
jgi:hypothetical protein